MNLIKMEDNFLSVWYALDIDLLNVSTLFPAFTNICFKESDAFPKLIILETYNYSPSYML